MSSLTCFEIYFNSLPNGKIWDMTRLKAFADDKINIFDRVENIVGKGENAFPTMFSKGFFLGVVKSRDCVVRVKGKH